MSISNKRRREKRRLNTRDYKKRKNIIKQQIREIRNGKRKGFSISFKKQYA